MWQKIKSSLFLQVIIALILGIVIGLSFHDFSLNLKPLGDGFISLIKMLIAPIVFCVVVLGIYGASDIKKMGKVGAKTILYFEVVTTIALMLGIAVAYIFKPGVGMNIDITKLDSKDLSTYTERAHAISSSSDFILHIIPKTLFGAFTDGDILQVLLIAILFGVSLLLIPKQFSSLVCQSIEAFSEVLFKMMGLIIRLAPLGVLGSVAYTTAKFGLDSLMQLGYLVILFYLTCIVFVVVILGSILKLAGLNIFKFLNYFKDELSIVLGTASSDSVLPQIMKKLRALGIKDSTVGLVIPTGYSFNLDGFSIYLTLGVIFIAQACNIDLSMHDLLAILLVSLVTSKGAHGIPGSALVILAATLSVIPSLPAIGLVLLLSVDWFIGIVRACTNLIGNCVATVVISHWEKDIDHAQAKAVLDQK
ncbi:C4-dicarboxylate transporter DctA [Acinetobacter ursingii]|uniref:C4-dicarboxylate transporter DctA n=1 Tax=Acinetobacter TaxID=469 RepID=UPI000E6AC927|nr:MULTISPECIES: C4-dicarboxylate transporter DctA [Acinetobacter]MDG9948513.1 C4-dicarboxylate transporter DctA [Acinetobacter ursingii]MDI3238483.1 C4-dicarboxylate transporter DctA [Acinetobacter ursingii]MEC6126874.1 C4-dicarboxylate transporter DctA [Acinetobacter ursingii]RSC21704.1 C4-dicarboxylate transporter DctA [Acinetobacter sp. FDAARGOS_515]